MPHRYPLDGLRRLAVGFTLCLFVQPVIASAGTVMGFQTRREWAVTDLTKRAIEIISKYVTEGIATLTKIGVEKVNGWTGTGGQKPAFGAGVPGTGNL